MVKEPRTKNITPTTPSYNVLPCLSIAELSAHLRSTTGKGNYLSTERESTVMMLQTSLSFQYHINKRLSEVSQEYDARLDRVTQLFSEIEVEEKKLTHCLKLKKELERKLGITEYD